MATSEDRMLDIAKRIRARREELGLSYQQLADETGMSKSTLQRYETGSIKNIPIARLKDLADALRTTPAYLMGWKREFDKTEWYLDSLEGLIKESITDREFIRLHARGHDSNGYPMYDLAPCTIKEAQLILQYWRLNAEGRAEAFKRVSELGEIGKYASERAAMAEAEISQMNECVNSTPDISTDDT